MMSNIPEVKLGIIAVSRDCFPIALSEKRRAAIVKQCRGGLYECPVTVENEKDMLRALEDVKAAGCNALVVFLGNFGPETPETLIAKFFDGPCMFVAAAEGDGDLINGRGDAYCGMLNCSYNLGMRHLKGYIPEYPVGRAGELGPMIRDFIPIARAIIGVKNLKIITFRDRGELRARPAGQLQGPRRRQAHQGGLRRHGRRDGRGQVLPRHARAYGAV